MPLQRHDPSSPLARAEQLHRWTEDALKRYAAQAAGERDAERLWRLTESFLTLHGRAGVATSKHTHRAYRRGVLDLVAAWQDEALLRPSRDAGTLYIQRLRAGDDTGAGAEVGAASRGRPRARGPLAPATVELRVAAARALYAALRWSGATEADPFRDVGAIRRVTRDEDVMASKVYTEREVVEMLAHADDLEDTVIVLLGAHAGLRVSEMLALTWEALDLESRRLLVRRGKGGKDGLVELTPKLAEALRAAEREMLVDVRRGTVLRLRSQYGVYRRLERLCRRADVTFRGVHGLRHAAGTRLYRQTGDLGLVQDHLRHATLDMARRYAKSDRRTLQRNLDDWT
jgi:integrase/recombinase XerC